MLAAPDTATDSSDAGQTSGSEAATGEVIPPGFHTDPTADATPAETPAAAPVAAPWHHHVCSFSNRSPFDRG